MKNIKQSWHLNSITRTRQEAPQMLPGRIIARGGGLPYKKNGDVHHKF